MNTEVKTGLLVILKTFDRYPNYGICGSVYATIADRAVSKDAARQLRVAFIQLLDRANEWEKFSGSSTFPVPCPSGGSPVVSFHRAEETRQMWTGKYGALREEFLRFLIDTLKEELEK